MPCRGVRFGSGDAQSAVFAMAAQRSRALPYLTHLGETPQQAADATEQINAQYDVAGHLLRGFLLVAADRCSEALPLAERAYQLDPDSDSCRLLLARCWYAEARELAARGRLDDAIRQCRKVIDLRPDFVYAYAQLAMIHAGRQQYEQAIAALAAGLERDPAYLNGRLFLAWLLQGSGRVDEAKVQLLKVLEAVPSSSLVQRYLRMLKRGEQDWEQVQEYKHKLKNQSSPKMFSKND